MTAPIRRIRSIGRMRSHACVVGDHGKLTRYLPSPRLHCKDISVGGLSDEARPERPDAAIVVGGSLADTLTANTAPENGGRVTLLDKSPLRDGCLSEAAFQLY